MLRLVWYEENWADQWQCGVCVCALVRWAEASSARGACGVHVMHVECTRCMYAVRVECTRQLHMQLLSAIC
jgi:hypothetical protein